MPECENECIITEIMYGITVAHTYRTYIIWKHYLFYLTTEQKKTIKFFF